MKSYFFPILTIFIIQCKGHSIKDKENSVKNIPYQAESNTSDTSKVDSITKFVRENLYYSSLINLSFCESELCTVLHNNDSLPAKWERKIKNLYKMFDDSLDNITTDMEAEFFRKRLIENSILKKRYPIESALLINSFTKNLDTALTRNQYQSLMLRFENAGGGNVNELSNVYFTCLIIDGQNFIKAIELSPRTTKAFNKWVNNIENTEFVAYGDDNVPPQLIERKRTYLVTKFSSSNDPLMEKCINKIRVSVIRSID